jgi:hypothetical protein
MDDEYLVSQRQAVKMLRDVGLSRTAAYQRLNKLPSRTLVDSRVWSRIDVELLVEKITRDAKVRVNVQ